MSDPVTPCEFCASPSAHHCWDPAGLMEDGVPACANHPARKSPGAGIMEAAGIEPASDPPRNGGISSGFRAEFDFYSLKLTVDSESPEEHWQGTFGWAAVPALGAVPFSGCFSLEEAIPQLERLLETAKLVYYGTQEVR